MKLTNVPSYNPVWSPDNARIAFYDGSIGGATFPLKSVSPNGDPLPIPDVAYRGEYEGYRFTPDGKAIVMPQGQFRAMDFWMIDIATGAQRRLTALKPGYSVPNFDISPDGKEILFDRVQENSDIVLINRR